MSFKNRSILFGALLGIGVTATYYGTKLTRHAYRFLRTDARNSKDKSDTQDDLLQNDLTVDLHTSNSIKALNDEVKALKAQNVHQKQVIYGQMIINSGQHKALHHITKELEKLIVNPKGA